MALYRERTRKKAQAYNAADYGLVGILKWTPKNKGLRLRWAKQLTQTRRSSLDLSLTDKAATNDKALPKQPRRRSMDDMSLYSHPPSFLELAMRKKSASLLRAACRATMLLSTFQHDRSWAATCIQALVRRYQQRVRFPIVVLERRLQDIEQQRERELDDVLHFKWKTMEKIRHDLEEPERKREETVKKAQELIKYLRDENTKIESKNSKISASMKQMRKMNDQYRDSTKLLLDNLSTMTEAIDALTEKNTMLVRAEAQYETELFQLQADLADLDERAAQEKKVRESTEEVMSSIIRSIKLRCDDSSLVTETTSMCERVREETRIPRPGSTFPSFVGDLDKMIMSSTVRSDVSARTFPKNGSFRSTDTTGSCSFANVTVDEDQMTMCTNDSYATAWTQ